MTDVADDFLTLLAYADHTLNCEHTKFHFGSPEARAKAEDRCDCGFDGIAARAKKHASAAADRCPAELNDLRCCLPLDHDLHRLDGED